MFLALDHNTSKWGSSDPAINQALDDRWEWLEHQASGNEATKRSAWRDLGDLGATEDRVRQSYTGRYAIELLQNAHDACADAGQVGTAWFEVTENALLVANQGVPFTAERIISLCRLGSSEKASRRGRDRVIGYKGIGFTAVFEISDLPEVLSQGVAFGFDRQEARRRVVQGLGQPQRGELVPARCFPLPLTREVLPSELATIKRFFDAGASTIVRLPYRSGCTASQVADHLRSSLVPEVLLFMPAIRTLEIGSSDARVSWTRKKARSIGEGVTHHMTSSQGERRTWLVRSQSFMISKHEVDALRDELWKDVSSLNVAVAFPIARGQLDPRPNHQPVYAYFPTQDRIGRGILVHGDFCLDEGRQRIAADGPQGVVSGRVTDAAVKLAVELAVSCAGQGNNLLCCLAPIDRPDGYGEHIAGKLDEALKSARICRPAAGARFVAPPALRRLATKLPIHRERELAMLMDPRSDLLRPGDDRGRAGDLLERLGCSRLGEGDVASRVALSTSRVSYDKALASIEAWVKSLQGNDFWVLIQLKGRPLVKDQSGKWCTPEAVVRLDSNTPPLPQFLEYSELRSPKSRAARALVARFDIDPLTAEVALSDLIHFLSERGTLSDRENEQALAFAWRLWQSEPSLFGSGVGVGTIPVPANATNRPQARSWRRADQTYFNVAWTGSNTLEAMYGQFGVAEFLAELPPKEPRAMRHRLEFFRALGVAGHPRMKVLTRNMRMYSAWSQLREVADAYVCHDDHPYSSRDVDCAVMDRLDELLSCAQRDPAFGIILARGLLSLKHPYGTDATVRCTHSAHKAKRRGNRTIGYQRWRLEQAPWVPVTHHPLNEQTARPDQAWTELPKSASEYLVPRHALIDVDISRLNLVDAHAPSRQAVEDTLRLLQSGYPELEAAPQNVRDTAEWLLRRLEEAAIRETKAVAKPPLLPAITSHGYTWAERPAIRDLLSMPLLANLTVLPSGNWGGLKRIYDLPLASRIVDCCPIFDQTAKVEPLLDERSRVVMLAILLRSAAPKGRTAQLLGKVREAGVSPLSVEWRPKDSQTVTVPCEWHLHLERDRDAAGQVVGVTLYRTPSLSDKIALGRALAHYLELPEMSETIALFLTHGNGIASHYALKDSEMEEAEELLRRRRTSATKNLPPSESNVATTVSAAPPDVTRVTPEVRPDLVPVPIAEPSRGRPSSRQAGADPVAPSSKSADIVEVGNHNYLEPNDVKFGPSRPLTVLPRSHNNNSGQQQRRTGTIDSSTVNEAGQDEELVSNPNVERRAMQIVERFGYEIENAESVRDVHTLNLGWDLEFHYGDGRVVPVEVKGASGAGSFVMTRNELRAAREQAEYAIYQVINIANPGSAALRIYRNFGKSVTDQHLKVLAWTVEGWRDLAPDEVPLEK